MNRYSTLLDWIDTEYEQMISLVEKWADINSGSGNLKGLETLLTTIQKDFSVLNGEMTIHPLSSYQTVDAKGNTIIKRVGKALSIKKRPLAPTKILLCGHLDTVYEESSSFQKVKRVDEHTLIGPGVTDMKGGLVILLKALQVLEQSPDASKIGWEVFLNPDEEIGSPGSSKLLQAAAQHHHIGLVFEPSFADGAFVSARKGSANYTILIKGKAAHAGRDFHLGASAIYAIARLINQLEQLNQPEKGITLNIGQIEGGGALNIVPDLAICRLNLRAQNEHDMITTQQLIEQIVNRGQIQTHIQIELFTQSFRLPKPFEIKTQKLFSLYKTCAQDLKIPFALRETGGVCDGNILSQAGLPTLDSIGAVGGSIHTPNEYLYLPSLTERAKLVSLFLLKIASGKIVLNKESNYGI